MLCISLTLVLGCGVGPIALAQGAAETDVEALFEQLAEPGREDWRRIETMITRLWERSGSASMDLLLERGNAALEADDLPLAIEFFTALTDHAPDFVEGWNARARAYFFLGQTSLSLGDTGRVLAMEPRHFEALNRLAVLFEEMDETELAIAAWQSLQDLNPNRPDAAEALSRLERDKGVSDL